MALLLLSASGAVGCSPDSSTTAPDGQGQNQGAAAGRVQTLAAVEPGEIAALLGERADAVAEGDLDGWLSTASAALGPSQTRVFDALQRLPLATWSYGQPEILSGPASRRARVSVPVLYRLAADETDATVTEVLELARQDDRWLIEKVTTTPTPPWSMRTVSVAQGKHSLIVGSAPDDVLGRYAAEADAAVAAVGEVWDEGWIERVVVFVPDTWDEGRQMLGLHGDFGGYAALTSPLEPAATPNGAGPVRILANPQVLEGLSAQSRQVVLTHEVFHVATWGMGRVPLWLSEGLGDYIGYLDSDISTTSALRGLLEAARNGSAPESLPPDAEFTGGLEASAAYEGAHLAVRLLAERYGVSRVTRFYREVAGAGDEEFAEEFRRTFRLRLETFTDQWRREINRLASR